MKCLMTLKQKIIYRLMRRISPSMYLDKCICCDNFYKCRYAELYSKRGE